MNILLKLLLHFPQKIGGQSFIFYLERRKEHRGVYVITIK